MPKNKKTPAERAEILEKAHSKAKKGYRINTKRDRKDVGDDEMAVIKDMLVSLRLVGYTPSQCAAVVGLSKRQVKEIVNDPNFKSRLESLKTKLPEAAVNLGRAYLVEAVQAVVHILRTETDNALILKAAAEIFDRFGIPKVSRAEVKSDPTPEQSGSEINETFMDRLRTAPPEIQEKVAALHESFTEGVERILSEGKPDGDTD
ncbi:MAG TPA: hypothetical protein VN039_12545 [Nitrospira sp.]|nr:hypothetical protein [Nitrospira sp.]